MTVTEFVREFLGRPDAMVMVDTDSPQWEFHLHFGGLTMRETCGGVVLVDKQQYPKLTETLARVATRALVMTQVKN